MVRYEPNSKQPCKNCNEEIAFVQWGVGPTGWWRHTDGDKFYCDYNTSSNEAEPIQPSCECPKDSNQFCAHCGTVEQLADAGILGFNSPIEDFLESNPVLEASISDIAYEMRMDRLGEYND